MSAKVDNTAIQAGYPLYHRAFFLSEEGKWAVVQQGMSAEDRTARRYHWLSDRVKEFVVEPHEAIVGDTKRDTVLNMTAKECRKASVDISKEKPTKFKHLLESARPAYQKSLRQWMPNTNDYAINILSMPEESTGMHYAKLTSFSQEKVAEFIETRAKELETMIHKKTP